MHLLARKIPGLAPGQEDAGILNSAEKKKTARVGTLAVGGGGGELGRYRLSGQLFIESLGQLEARVPICVNQGK